jgi:hypothetical protein
MPLPRYVERKPTKAGWAYLRHTPSCAKKAGCPRRNEALGLDYDAAVKRAEKILLPAFDAWRSGKSEKETPTQTVAKPGTLVHRFHKADHLRRIHAVHDGLYPVF